jgi:Sec-independent protein translocase protein TatA
MFDIGWAELIIVAIIAVVVLATRNSNTWS